MTTQFFAVLTILSAVLATLGSLLLAYDYLDPARVGARNPLWLLLRLVVPTLAGMFPGLFVLLAFSAAHVEMGAGQTLNVLILVIALGAMAGLFSGLSMRDADDGDSAMPAQPQTDAGFQSAGTIGRMLARAATGLLLGVASGVATALLARTSLDNALTIAGATGPLGMITLGVWPLVDWTPAPSKVYARQRRMTRRSRWAALPGIALLCLLVGVVNGFFDARAPQHLATCASDGSGCAAVLETSAALNIGGALLVHGALFLVGGVLTTLLWAGLEPALIAAWEALASRSLGARRLAGALLTGACGAFLTWAILSFVLGAASAPLPYTETDKRVAVVSLLFIGAVVGFLRPLRPLRDALRAPLPFSRFDALLMTAFLLAILFPYVALTNLANLAATVLGLPHALSPQTTPPIQIQRIEYFGTVALLLGAPIAFVVGGLTRSVYRWVTHLPHRTLGGIGIGLGLLAFLLQLVEPSVTLFMGR